MISARALDLTEKAYDAACRERRKALACVLGNAVDAERDGSIGELCRVVAAWAHGHWPLAPSGFNPPPDVVAVVREAMTEAEGVARG